MALPNPTQSPTPAAPVFLDPSAPEALYRLEPTAPFRLRYRADLWEVVTLGLEEPALVPQLSVQWLLPGCNGVFPLTDKRDAAEVAKLAGRKSQDRGFQVLDPDLPIPADCLPPGVPPGGYLRVSQCRGQNKVVGKRHHERFVTFTATFEGPAREVWHMGHRNRWLAGLVRQGVFGRPTEEVLSRLEGQARTAFERALSVPWPAEVRAERVERARAPLAALEAAAERKPAGRKAPEGADESPVGRARALGWEYTDLTGSGDGNQWGEAGGRSRRTGLTMAEMSLCAPPPGWAAAADAVWPWELPGWKAPGKKWTPPKMAPKGGPRA